MFGTPILIVVGVPNILNFTKLSGSGSILQQSMKVHVYNCGGSVSVGVGVIVAVTVGV